MANYAKPLPLRDGNRRTLEAMTHGKSASASLALRARTVLLAANGTPHVQIQSIAGFSEPTVRHWRTRYEESGIEGLMDAARPGKPRKIDDIAIVVDTLANDGIPPAELGISHWSARVMAERHDVSFASVARVWRP